MDLPFPTLAIRLDVWLREDGPPSGRSSFAEVRNLLNGDQEKLTVGWLAKASAWPPSLRLGFGLACCLANHPLSKAIPLEAILASLPDDRLEEIPQFLDRFGIAEVVRLLTPVLMKPGEGSERAAWLLAESSASLPLADLPAVLQSRIWSQEGQSNLLCLVPMVFRGDAAQLFRDLLPTFQGDQKAQIQKMLDRLTNGGVIKPTIPHPAPAENAEPVALTPISSVSAKSEPTVSRKVLSPTSAAGTFAAGTLLPPQLPESVSHAFTSFEEVTSPLDVPETGLLARVGEAASNLYFLLGGAMVLAVFLGFILFTSPSTDATPATARPGEKIWIDAVTRRPLTESFLKADKEFRMGEIFRIRGQMQDAAVFFRTASAIDPTHVDALDRLGYCLYKLKSPEAATEVFQKALKVDPDFYRSHFYLARIYRNSQRWTEALVEFRRAFAGKKNLAQIGIEYLELLNQLGLFEEGRPVAAELMRRFSTNRELAQLQGRIAREDR